AGPVLRGEARGERIRILVDEEGAIALPVGVDGAGPVARDLDETQLAEVVVQVAELLLRGGVFDEFEAVDAHRVLESGDLHAKIGLCAHGGSSLWPSIIVSI